jgi:rubrerythrin
MDIIEFAMQMELDGKAFYERNAATATDPELKKMFTMLAEEEQRHYNFFSRLKEGRTHLAIKQIDARSSILDHVKNIFRQLSERRQKKSFDHDVKSAWTEALRIEEKAENFYREKAEIENDGERKKLLNLIADEERNHIHMIDGVLTYLKYPETFAESAQFKNFMSWEGH